MSAGTYDPFAVERPVLKLGDHGSWTLGDITDTRHAKLVEWHGHFAEVQKREDTKVADLARVVGELCSHACIGGDEIPDLLVSLTDEELHGDSALGVLGVASIAEFIMGWLAGEESAGNV